MLKEKDLFKPLSIELEMRREQASAMKRLGHKLEALIEELKAIEDVAEHKAKRAEAEKYYWYLMVQREALGLRNHEDLKRLYPIPPPL